MISILENFEMTKVCALCDQAVETLNHLLAHCVVAREAWFKVLRQLGWQHLTALPTSTTVQWWLTSRKRLAKARRRGFDSLVLLVAWSLWLERNSKVFDRRSSTVAMLVAY
jgi:hypothetical protein